MRARLGSIALFVALALLGVGCEGKGYLVITVDSAQPMSITALDVTIRNNGKVGRATLGKAFSLPPAQDFAVQLPDDRRGMMTVELVARSGTTEVGRGMATATVVGSGNTELTIELTKMEMPGADLLPAADLLVTGGVDLAGDLPSADLTAVESPDLAAPEPDLATAEPDLAVPASEDLAVSPSPDLWHEDLLATPDMTEIDLLTFDLLPQDLLPQLDLRAPVLAFAPGTALTVTDPQWVVIDDIDAVLGKDIVYVDATGVHWQSGLGDGTFAAVVVDVPGMTGSAPAGFSRVAVGKLNADADNDIVATRSTIDPKVYLATTVASVLTPLMPIAAGTTPSGVLIGNADATNLDLFVTSTPDDSDALGVLLGAGDGSFAAVAPYTTCVDPLDLAGGDVNDDTRTDVAVACSGTSGDMTRKPGIYVSLTDGSGLSTTTRILSDASERAFAGVALADVVGNAGLDVVGACPDCNQVQIFGNDGTGTFAAPQEFAVGDLNLPATVAVGDVDGDGDLDIVVGGTKQAAGTGGIAVLLGDGAGNFAAVTAARRFATDLTVRQVVIADLDGDSLAEIIMVTDSGIAVLKNTTS